MRRHIIYHNPNCSKSRAALSILQQHNVSLEIIEYLQSPPSTDNLKRILRLLNCGPIALMRTQEDVFKELNLDAGINNDESLISAMASQPILIERPIVICDDKAIIAKPPEKALELL
jgi:arsenate reductase